MTAYDDAHRWYSANWDPSMPVGQWWQLLAESGYGYPSWPTDRYGLGLRHHESREADRARNEIGAFGPPSGVGVISDIDDTIKISHVLDKKELMRHTFAKPFEAVPGMAKAYAAWAERGATFHYVSSSPWQLYPLLASFLDAEAFPAGAFHMKSVRLKNRTLLSLFKSSLETKPPIIRSILARYPRHRFVLVGDSGEKDPEVYGLVMREHPGRVLHAYIRRVVGAANGDVRFRKAFEGVDAAKWTVFKDAAELKPG